MNIAIRHQTPSLESSFIAKSLRFIGDVDELDPWDVRSCTVKYDVAVCIGPVDGVPIATKSVLLALGLTVSHPRHDWDMVLVTSDKAVEMARERFGLRSAIRKTEVPLLGLHYGWRRLMDFQDGLMHASEACWESKSVKMLRMWGKAASGHSEVPEAPVLPDTTPEQFTALGFNSLVRSGATGFYPFWMEDGYDLQVRRHLALGGRVMCNRDPAVLGDLADLCGDLDTYPTEFRTPVECKGDASEWASEICEMVRSV